MTKEREGNEINKPITIDIAELEKLNLTPSQYYLAYCIFYDYRGTYNKMRVNYGHEESFKEDLHQLIKKGYLKSNDPENKYRIVFEKCIISGIFTDSPDDKMTWDEFIDAYRDTFPAGVQSGGFYVKSSKIDIEKKLKKFVKEYKYSKEIILEAVKQYVAQCGQDNYKYMKLSHYFIYKNGESMLASACDAVEQGVSSGSIPTIFLDKL